MGIFNRLSLVALAVSICFLPFQASAQTTPPTPEDIRGKWSIGVPNFLTGLGPIFNSAFEACQRTYDEWGTFGWTMVMVPQKYLLSAHCYFHLRQFPWWGVGPNGKVHHHCLHPTYWKSVFPGVCVKNAEIPRPPAACSARSPVGGNPIILSTGYKVQQAQDYDGGGSVGLVVRRTYRSIMGGAGQAGLSLGPTWIFAMERVLVTGANPVVELGDGSVYGFNGNGAGGFTASGDAPGIALVLIDSATQWYEFRDLDGRVDQFQLVGSVVQMVSSRFSDGSSVTYGYDANGKLANVTDHRGRQVNIVRSGQTISQIMLPEGKIEYEYDRNLSNTGTPIEGTERLLKVAYSKLDGSDASEVQYVYDDPNFSWFLTGLIDETGTRFATYTYDVRGRTVASEHAGGAGRVELAFDDATGNTSVTDSLGATRVYTFANVNNIFSNTSVSQPGGAGCAAASASQGYDSYGNITKKVDFTGRLSCMSYDTARGLMTQKVEGLSGVNCPGTIVSGVSRTTTYEWHPTLRKNTRIAEPERIRSFTYDAQGNNLTQSIQATTDTSGALGFTAIVQGPVRTWSRTYDAQNQPLLEDGPLPGTADASVNEYYAADDTQTPKRWRKGDLQKITNAQGHISTFEEYDQAGRWVQSTDPNGRVMRRTYHHRGWLLVSSEAHGGITYTTSYEYWPTGKLKKVTQPDGSWFSYEYDAAQRLNQITDSQGNTVRYTLNGVGSITLEEFRDPGGALKRSISRAYDALGRAATVTGAVQ